MAAETAEPAEPAGKRRSGWITFAAVVMLAVAAMRLISAIYYFVGSDRVDNVSGGAFGHHLAVWGFWDTLIFLLGISGGLLLLRGGGTTGLLIAYSWAGLLLVQSLLLLAAAPWYGFAGLILSSLVIYGLAHSDPDAIGMRPGPGEF